MLNLSGGNIIGMLSDVLRRNEREELNSRYIKALENIAKVYLNFSTRSNRLKDLIMNKNLNKNLKFFNLLNSRKNMFLILFSY